MTHSATTFEFLVVGKGLIGSAAARYLSQKSDAVVLVGPGEKNVTDPGHQVFASHYDEGRVTLQMGRDPLWTKLNQMAISEYGRIEADSGIIFHHPVGCLYVTPDAADPFLQRARVFRPTPVTAVRHYASKVALANAFPEFSFSEAVSGVYEGGPAGQINPRALLRAQTKLFRDGGGTVIEEVVLRISPKAGHYEAITGSSRVIRAQNVLIAAGSFSNFHELLPQQLQFSPESETILLAEVSPETASQLALLPSLLYETATERFNGIYLVRPLLFPDDKYYLKMGCNLTEDIAIEALTQAQQWFREGPSDASLPVMESILRQLMPGLAIQSLQTKRCIISRTPGRHPYIGRVDDHGWFVATGGNGYSAKCSDSIGNLAARLMATGDFGETFREQEFRPVF